MKNFLPLLFLISFSHVLAQGVTISGRIVDSETLEPLPYAHVFIDQTTIGTVSDENGDYILEHVENGDYKLVFSFVGYEMYFATVSVTGSNIRVSARLVPSKEMLESVEVRGTKDKEWEKQLKRFNRVFFGDNELGKECRILNPWVLDFTIDWDKKFIATASAPLQIENNALGYKIDCTLQGFTFDKEGYKIRGVYRFEEVNTLDKKEASKWTRNRRLSYQNSLRFLFKSMIEDHESENGFELYRDLRPSLQTNHSGYFVNELGSNRKEFKTKENIQPLGRPGHYKIILTDRLEIHHTTQFAQTKSYRDIAHPVSWIETEKGYVLASQDGNLINYEDIVTSGELNNYRIASMLPKNYSPGNMVVINYITKRAKAKRLQEKIYLQSDKGIYYPGETVWFKVYPTYFNQAVKDSLSRVIYVDLISSQKEIIESKMLKLDSTGGAWGEFSLSARLNAGTYFLRAYTQWMLNYGPEIIFHRPILVQPGNMQISSNEIDPSNDDFILNIKRNPFSLSGGIEVTAILDSSYQHAQANCSISITPIGANLPSPSDIHDSLFFPEEMPEGTLADFIYPLEYSFTLDGLLYRPNKKYTSGVITGFRGNMDSLYFFKTNKRGKFTIEQLDFYDTMSFSFQGKNKKDRVIGKVKLLDRPTPDINLPGYNLRKLDIDTLLLNYSANELIASTNDSTKENIKENETSVTQSLRSISNADYVIGPNELSLIGDGTNIIDALLGRIPGLSMNPQTGMLSFSNRGQSSQNSGPLIVVDGIPMNMMGSSNQSTTEASRLNNNTPANELAQRQSQESTSFVESNIDRSSQPSNDQNVNSNSSQRSMLSARDLVGHISVEYVSRVEVNLRGDSRYGSSSANGVISIFTQKVPRSKVTSTFETFIIQGYATPKTFIRSVVPLTHEAINCSTIYWNPSVTISSKTQTTFNLKGLYQPGKYLIRVEGLRSDGKPVSGSLMFNLEKSSDQTKARF